MAEKTDEKLKSRSILVGLFLLFLLPIVISWYLVFYTDYKPGGEGTQHGVLINPPRRLADLQLTNPLTGDSHSLYGRWTMFTFVEGDCDQTCTNDLYRMRQIRLATGKEASRVQRAIYFTDNRAANTAGDLFREYPGQLLVTSERINKEQLSLFALEGTDREHAIYLIDPAGYLMMIYPAGTDPTGIIRDMKRLLRISSPD